MHGLTRGAANFIVQNVFFFNISFSTIGKYLRKFSKALQNQGKKGNINSAKDERHHVENIYSFKFTEECKMAVKKATVDSTMAKVEAAKTEVKAAPAKAAAPKKTAPAKAAAEKKAAPAKAAAPKKAAPAKKAATAEKVVIEYAGGSVVTADIVARAKEVSGKKTIKELNVYYQPETGMVYFTADGEEGSFAL